MRAAKRKMRRIGILTGGGDCPGLNAVIRAAVIRCEQAGILCYGLKYGWRGAIEKDYMILDKKIVKGIQTEGGTILGSSRTNVLNVQHGIEHVRETMNDLKLDAVLAIGGDDTLGVALELSKEGFNMIGVPKTIDNDILCTDYTFGFDTAASIAMEAIERIKTTAASHERTIVVEVMGRHTGWIALEAAVAADAHMVLIPEFPVHMDEIIAMMQKRRDEGKVCDVIVVAEGFWPEGLEFDEHENKDSFGNVLLAERELAKHLANAIKQRTNRDVRHLTLGHMQRGGNPTMFDRFLGTRMGTSAVELVMQGDFGKMVALQGTEIVGVPLENAMAERKKVPKPLFEMANTYISK